MDPFIAQIVLFAGNFAPRGWAFCDGQLLSISQHTALFSILGTVYGGDGRTTFALPDLRGRLPLHPGSGPGLPSYSLGQKGGTFEITQPPAHTHTFNVPCAANPATQPVPVNAYPAVTAGASYAPAPNTPMGPGTTASTGASGGVSVQNPYAAIHFIIALQGIHPTNQ